MEGIMLRSSIYELEFSDVVRINVVCGSTGILNKEISIGNKHKYVDTNMVRSEFYNCGSKCSAMDFIRDPLWYYGWVVPLFP
jgi:hypothetical protein